MKVFPKSQLLDKRKLIGERGFYASCTLHFDLQHRLLTAAQL